jgi:peptidoglycan hydrolase CwlO-like protein
MSRRKLIILTFLTALFGVVMIQNTSFSQSKKKQIEALNFEIDSVNQVIAKERNAQKNVIGSLEIQESKSKQKVDSLTNEIKTIENQISSQQKKKQKKELEIWEIKNEIDTAKEPILYQPKPCEKPKNDPFGNW